MPDCMSAAVLILAEILAIRTSLNRLAPAIIQTSLCESETIQPPASRYCHLCQHKRDSRTALSSDPSPIRILTNSEHDPKSAMAGNLQCQVRCQPSAERMLDDAYCLQI